VRAVADEIIRRVSEFSRDIDSYGIIHNDFHPWNFYIDGNVYQSIPQRLSFKKSIGFVLARNDPL
jgi:Ser/Thr protein kinase RdoA (MazF antagonist)